VSWTMLGADVTAGIETAVGGIVAVLLICAVFYAVGRGEDRDRVQAQHDAEPDEPAGEQTPADPAATAPPHPRPRPSAQGRRRR
jgi:hypothetical protein